jgi:hypothetical protein
MAIVGDAYIVVKAITTGFESEVRRAANGINLNREGTSVGDTFSRGFSRGIGNGLGNSLSSFERSAIAARKQFQALVRTSYFLGPALSMLVSTIGTLAGGLVSLASSLVAAAPSAIVFASALTSIGIAAVGLLGALSGVAKAISAGTKANLAGKKNSDAYQESLKRLALATERVAEAQRDFAEAAEDAREEVQQLGFDAEDAALSESKAAIELEKARETLQRVQDLPPNSRARREANLAFQEAELNLRRAKDKNSDLRKEQERLAKAAVIAGTTQAEQTDTYLDAQKRVIDAVRDQQDAQDAVNKAKEGGTQDATFQQALSDLSKEAQRFVRYMVGTFIPSLKTLRDALGKQLFSQLEIGLERLRTKLFPSLRPVLEQLGDDIGKAFTKIIDAVVKPENITKLTKVIAQSGVSIQSFATSLGNIYSGFLTLLVAAEPLINRFNKFIENKTAYWADFLNLKEASGELRDFFNKSGDIAAKIGSIFGNVFRTISNIVKANFAPGGGGHILLDWLKEVTNRWDTFSGSVTGQQKLTKYFRDVAINAKAVLSTIGAFLKEILKAGADPNVAAFWNTLKQGAPAFGELLGALNTAGPALAKFIVAFMNFAKVTLSSGAISVFIGILTGALNMLTKILDNPGMQALFNTGAKILAVGLAFGSLSKVLSFAVKVIAGSFMSLGNAFKFLLNPMTSLRAVLVPAISSMAGAVGLAVGPFLAIVAAVAALVAILVIAYNKSEIFREAISNFATAIGTTFKDGFSKINEAIDGVAPALGGLGGVFKALGDAIGKYVVPVLQFVVTSQLKVAITIITTLIRVVGSLANAFASIAGVVKKSFDAVISIMRGTINLLSKLWNNTLGKIKMNLPKIGSFGGGTIGFPTIPEFAEGGTVYPSSNGTIARVAEAGRPERIEPLDPDGLSKRDKAMIKLLSGEKGAGMTVNVYPSPGMDETELASLVSRQIAFQLRRGGA